MRRSSDLLSVSGLLIVLLLLLAVSPKAYAQGQRYDLSQNLVSKVPLTTDPSGSIAGIYATDAKSAVVVVDRDGFVGPGGAGRFLNNTGQPLGHPSCTIAVRRAKGKPEVVELPLKCKAGGLWYLATVTDDFSVLSSDGESILWRVARPLLGSLTSLGVQSGASPEMTNLTLEDKGWIHPHCQITLANFGDAEILVRANVSSAHIYVILSPGQLRKIAEAFPEADRRNLARFSSE